MGSISCLMEAARVPQPVPEETSGRRSRKVCRRKTATLTCLRRRDGRGTRWKQMRHLFRHDRRAGCTPRPMPGDNWRPSSVIFPAVLPWRFRRCHDSSRTPVAPASAGACSRRRGAGGSRGRSTQRSVLKPRWRRAIRCWRGTISRSVTHERRAFLRIFLLSEDFFS